MISNYIDEDGRNIFDINEEFFLIDSNNLMDIRSRLYGFSVQESGIYENENLTPEAVMQMNGRGCYVYINASNRDITITQDFNGSWGIYIFQIESYFALSNSFFRLLDHIKGKHLISLDRDYCNHIIGDGLTSFAYSETPIKEVKLIPKNAIIKIDLVKSQLFFEYIDYKENSVSLNSKEGLAILDHWFERWTTIFRKLKKETDNITVALSGGFDSRITFLLFLCSGINLNEICVRSLTDNLHTHAEDYEIASSIAQYYDFKLNNFSVLSKNAMHYSLQDIINMSFYTKMGFHKEMYFKSTKYENKRYAVAGVGGECIRAHWWDMPADRFIQINVNLYNRYSKKLAQEMGNSVATIIKNAYDALGHKFHIDESNSIEYPIYLYRENRCRSHFGKAAVEDFFSNQFTLQPLIDPDLRKIRLHEPECGDYNLLMAMIYVRYCPKLLDFKFEGNRSISKNTINFASQINEKFPYLSKNMNSLNKHFNVITVDSKVSEQIKNNNIQVTEEHVQKYFKDAFDSVSFRKLFAMYFDEEIYCFAKQSYEKSNYFPLRECFSTLAIGKVIKDIIVSESIMQPVPSHDLDYFIQNNDYCPNDMADIISNFKDYITARIDIKLKSNKEADFEISDISDTKISLLKPASLQKDGICMVIESYAGTLDFSIKIKGGEGDLTIALKSRFVFGKNKEVDRIPYWIDYHFCEINNTIQFSEIRPAWHDQPIYFTRHVASGDKFNLRLKWSPHRSDKA